MSAILRLEGHEVTGFADATDAISRIEAGLGVDVILLDLMRPVRSGWEFCERRRQSETLKKVPVIIVTARQSIDPPAGVSEVLLKPFDPQGLEDAIARALATRDASPAG